MHYCKYSFGCICDWISSKFLSIVSNISTISLSPSLPAEFRLCLWAGRKSSCSYLVRPRETSLFVEVKLEGGECPSEFPSAVVWARVWALNRWRSCSFRFWLKIIMNFGFKNQFIVLKNGSFQKWYLKRSVLGLKRYPLESKLCPVIKCYAM